MNDLAVVGKQLNIAFDENGSCGFWVENIAYWFCLGTLGVSFKIQDSFSIIINH